MTILEKLARDGLIFDGAMGTMLMSEGGVSEQINIDKPEKILEIHKAYLAAGADVITTNTFGGSSFKLAKAGLDARAKKINNSAARLARQAAGPEHFVAGDIGPSGEMLEPLGNVSFTALKNAFAEQAQYLQEKGVDVFIVETMFDIQEALAAIEGIRSVSELPIFATLTFESKPTGFATIMGNRVSESMQQLAEAGAAAVGANCSIGSDQMVALADEIRQSVTGPVIIQPNAGLPQTRDGKQTYPESPAFFAANMKKIRALGVEIIGGCCGTTPQYIATICKYLSEK